MRGVSLFSGIGGLDLAAECANVSIVGQVEIDPYCQQILARHWPQVRRYADVRHVTGSEFGQVDLIFGGIPCQPFSVAGNQRGRADERYLWPEMRRLVQATQPHWVVVENVANIAHVALDDIWRELEDDGYACGAYVLPATAVNAPHRRERLFVVAHTQRGRRRWRTHAASWHNRYGTTPEWYQGAHGTTRPGTFLSEHDSAAIRHLHERAIALEFESRLGRILDGIPAWMDAARWPSAPTHPQHAWERERATTLLTDALWKNRVRALGNAVVPQQAFPIFAALMAVDEFLDTAGEDA